MANGVLFNMVCEALTMVQENWDWFAKDDPTRVHIDEDGEVYLLVPFELPAWCEAELDHDTYGDLSGIRVYKGDL